MSFASSNFPMFTLWSSLLPLAALLPLPPVELCLSILMTGATMGASGSKWARCRSMTTLLVHWVMDSALCPKERGNAPIEL